MENKENYIDPFPETWTEENERVYRPLHRKYERLRFKAMREKKRERKYSPRSTRRSDVLPVDK